MTFKHIGFGDSVVMRSLEKVALEKGLVKKDELKKQASNNSPDYSPSSNLLENIIKLCTGLRTLGFEKHANELESKFMEYKRANTLYNVSKETGEDLIDSAHPEGSHKLKGVEGDAIIETILDQHLKTIKMVEKNPTGKLASSTDVINAVKKIVGQVGSEYKFDTYLKPDSISPVEEKVNKDTPWTDGARANSNFIKYNLANAVLPLKDVTSSLSQLQTLAQDSRVSPQVGIAVGNGKKFVENFLKNYLTAVQGAVTKAKQLEQQRLVNVNDLDQSRVSFNEVSEFFTRGDLGKTRLKEAKDFNELLLLSQNLVKGLGNLIYDRFSPGFDFDQPYMKGLKDKAFGLFNKIKSDTGSL